MKKVAKFLIAGGALLLGGALIFVIAMSTLKWDFYKLDTTTYEAKAFAPDSAEQVTAVNIDLKTFPVTVTRGDKLALNYYTASDSEVSVSVEGGVLKIAEQYEFKFFKASWFNLGRLKHKFQLTVPDGTDISLSGTNGDISLSGINTSRVTVDCTNADIKLSDCNITDLGIDGTNANVKLSGCVAESVNIKSTNLDFTLNNCNIGSVTARGTNADVEINGGEFASADISGTNADIEIKNLRVDNLRVKATNLDAEIYITGDKSEYGIVTNGKNLPPQQTGSTSKTITLSGTNNDVKLRFV